MSETCRACTGPNEVHIDEDVPLCNEHWNAWLSRYLNADSYPPCNAHVIRATEDEPLEPKVIDRIEAAARASAKDEDASNWDDEHEHYRNGWYTRMAPGIAAADAHDAAHGIHRVSLDDATVERAARMLIEDGQFGVPWDDAFDRERAETMDLARSVLAAAVEARQ